MRPTLAVLTFLLCLPAAFLLAEDARSLFQDGLRSQENEDYESAVEKYKASLARNPSFVSPMTGLAESFLQLEEFDESLRWVAAARKLDRNNQGLRILEGRVRLAQGDIAGARGLFQEVLTAQPNDLEARFGMAEIDVVEGRTRNAMNQYVQALKLSPESRKALLSLTLLCEETGDEAGAARYLELALKNHAGDASVQLAAAEYNLRRGNLETAERHARTALSIRDDPAYGRITLGKIQLARGKSGEAAETLRAAVASRPDDELSWYCLGLSYGESGETDKAMNAFLRALVLAPDDEIARIAQEAVALNRLKEDDATRKKLGAYHREQGTQLLQKNYLEKAFTELRRSVMLDPLARDGRVAYARMYRTYGFPGKYLNELEFLKARGFKDNEIIDEIDILGSELADVVSRQWNVDQFLLERKRYSIPVFTVESANRFVHPFASDSLCAYFKDLLLRHDWIRTDTEAQPTWPLRVSGFQEAFQQARRAETDYFIVLSFDESERGFYVRADIYLARTGASLGSFDCFRTGNGRIRDAVLKVSSQIASLLPPRAVLLARNLDAGLIDQGSMRGLKKDDKLVIVKQGKVHLDAEAVGLQYGEADVIGDFTVKAPDEAVAEGSVVRRGWFDSINLGDEVLFPVARKPKPAADTAAQSKGLLARLFGIGK